MSELGTVVLYSSTVRKSLALGDVHKEPSGQDVESNRPILYTVSCEHGHILHVFSTDSFQSFFTRIMSCPQYREMALKWMDVRMYFGVGKL